MAKNPKTNVVVFLDIDGVVADITKRLHFIQDDPEHKDFEKFYGAYMADDKPIYGNIDFLYWAIKALAFGEKENVALHVVALTGRPKRTATLTKLWMKENCFELQSFIDEWVFRPDRDWTPSSNFKARKVEEIMHKMHNLWDAGGGEWIDVIFDDDPTNVASMSGKISRNHPDDHVLALTVGTSQFVKLMSLKPAFACKCPNGCENCTSCEEESSCQSSPQYPK